MDQETERMLLCTDLDRTLLPNGEQPESLGARAVLNELLARSAMMLAYVSGRRLALHESAMTDYDLPEPDYAITDVGTAIFRRTGSGWEEDVEWKRHIAESWKGHTAGDLAAWLEGIPGLELQAADAQSPLKLSYESGCPQQGEECIAAVGSRLHKQRVECMLVWSVDETVPLGLLDVLPARAGKLNAIRWLAERCKVLPENLVFAGDSGNDLEVLASGIQSVLVANATKEVREQAQELVRVKGHESSLYLAVGGYRGMNGNYAAGIVEGLVHFLPDLENRLPGLEPRRFF